MRIVPWELGSTKEHLFAQQLLLIRCNCKIEKEKILTGMDPSTGSSRGSAADWWVIIEHVALLIRIVPSISNVEICPTVARLLAQHSGRYH